MTTPTVASTMAGVAAMRSVANRVSKPESKRMMASAIEPMKKAAGRSLKAIPPIPS